LPPSFRIASIRGDRGSDVDFVDLEVEGDRAGRKPNLVHSAVWRAFELAVVNEKTAHCYMIGVDRGRDIAIPLLENVVDLALGISAIAVQEHHDALHQNLTISVFTRKPARSSICTESAKPFNELLGRDHACEVT
jgi:hypothetical protein